MGCLLVALACSMRKGKQHVIELVHGSYGLLSPTKNCMSSCHELTHHWPSTTISHLYPADHCHHKSPLKRINHDNLHHWAALSNITAPTIKQYQPSVTTTKQHQPSVTIMKPWLTKKHSPPSTNMVCSTYFVTNPGVDRACWDSMLDIEVSSIPPETHHTWSIWYPNMISQHPNRNSMKYEVLAKQSFKQRLSILKQHAPHHTSWAP